MYLKCLKNTENACAVWWYFAETRNSCDGWTVLHAFYAFLRHFRYLMVIIKVPRWFGQEILILKHPWKSKIRPLKHILGYNRDVPFFYAPCISRNRQLCIFESVTISIRPLWLWQQMSPEAMLHQVHPQSPVSIWPHQSHGRKCLKRRRIFPLAL